MSAPVPPGERSPRTPPVGLSQRSFPRRVRALLEGVLEYASSELERGLNATLDDYEQTLFKQAEQARSAAVQTHFMEALREVRRTRADLAPSYLIGLESALASIQDPPKPAETAQRAGELSLVADVEFDEKIALNEIAGRAEVRHSLPLFLLGQRFGVIAGRPAFDAETLPIGPHALCRIMRSASECLHLATDHRLLLFRQFDRQFLLVASHLYEVLNTYLIQQKVLPHLSYVPIRVQRPTPVGSDRAAPRPPLARLPETASSAPQPARDDQVERRRGRDVAPAASTAATALQGPEDLEAFETLRQLLSNRRGVLGKLGAGGGNGRAARVAEPEQVQGVLGRLQTEAATTVMQGGRAVPRSIGHLKQDLLAQLRQTSPDGSAAALPDADNDTIDLVGMLYDYLMKDVRPNSPAAALLTKLQVPLLRVAMDDKGFFTRQQHPARQMLNAIAESGAYLSSEDEVDRGVVDKMRMLVDRVNTEFDGDTRLFDRLLGDLTQHLQTQARKAEVAERRHVEAARGREKLESARLHAAQAIDAMVHAKRVPKFLRTLLDQSWSDVLALSSLRGGEDSTTYQQQLAIAGRLVDSALAQRKTGAPLIDAVEAQRLREQIEEALLQVGYHQDDAGEVARKLLASSVGEDEDDPASRTELALRLKQRGRLGQDVQAGGSGTLRPEQLSASERQRLDELKHLPFGSWFEFIDPASKQRQRRRMSWYSTLTGHCLFVNHRGQRVAEESLPWLAREIAAGRASVVKNDGLSLVDRAWQAIVNTLKSFGRTAEATP